MKSSSRDRHPVQAHIDNAPKHRRKLIALGTAATLSLSACANGTDYRFAGDPVVTDDTIETVITNGRNEADLTLRCLGGAFFADSTLLASGVMNLNSEYCSGNELVIEEWEAVVPTLEADILSRM